MKSSPSSDALYETLVVQPSMAYREAIGPAVHLDAQEFEQFLTGIENFRGLYPNMAFWQILDYKTLKITHSDGDLTLFGQKLQSFKDLFQLIHPAYVQPYLRWRSAAFSLIYTQPALQLDPLKVTLSIGLPLQLLSGDYFWFTMKATIVQVDATGRIVTNLQTFYQESKWSDRNLRPVEASLGYRNTEKEDWENLLLTQLSLQMIDEFTDAELELLSLYAAGKSPANILEIRGWSKHTLHEYNANILRKAKKIFVYDFRNARNFAEYCLEKGFIQFRGEPPT